MDDEDIDPSPFQLTKKTSLYRVLYNIPNIKRFLQIHTIFSMLQLSKAYVTDCGRLVGVVALTDVDTLLDHFKRDNFS